MPSRVTTRRSSNLSRGSGRWQAPQGFSARRDRRTVRAGVSVGWSWAWPWWGALGLLGSFGMLLVVLTILAVEVLSLSYSRWLHLLGRSPTAGGSGPKFRVQRLLHSLAFLVAGLFGAGNAVAKLRPGPWYFGPPSTRKTSWSSCCRLLRCAIVTARGVISDADAGPSSVGRNRATASYRGRTRGFPGFRAQCPATARRVAKDRGPMGHLAGAGPRYRRRAWSSVISCSTSELIGIGRYSVAALLCLKNTGGISVRIRRDLLPERRKRLST